MARERWFNEQPLLRIVNCEVLNAACLAANAIVSTLFTITFVEDDDIEF